STLNNKTQHLRVIGIMYIFIHFVQSRISTADRFSECCPRFLGITKLLVEVRWSSITSYQPQLFKEGNASFSSPPFHGELGSHEVLRKTIRNRRRFNFLKHLLKSSS